MSKFGPIYEAAMQRYQRGGFLVGDRVEFVKGFKSKPEYKELNDKLKECLQEIESAGLNIRVIDIKNDSPSYYPANPGYSSGNNVVLDIALDSGGGRYTHQCTIPNCLVSPINDGINLPPIPDGAKRPNNVQITPVEAEEDQEHITRKTDRGDGKLSNTEVNLPRKNTSIPSKSASPDPAVNAYLKSMASK
jgi:hypothetical protein